MSEQKYIIEKPSSHPDVVVIRFGKQIMGGVEAMEFSAIINDLSASAIRCLIVDMSEVDFINSSGLGMLVNGLSSLSKYEILLKLTSLPEKVMNLLKMTHLNEVFSIYESIENALESI